MNPLDIILVVLIAAAVIFALIKIYRDKKRGKGCGCGCEHCQNTACKKNRE